MSGEDAHKRAIEDYSQFSQYSRASAQFAFAANGGAALAMLSFLTALTTAKDATKNVSLDAITHSFAFAATFYLGGLFFSVIAMYAMSLSKQYWGHFWEHAALTGNIDFQGTYAKRGTRMNSLGFVLLILSALAFLPGSAFAVAGFWAR